MPVLRRGGVVRFYRERLEAWLARQESRLARQVTQGSRTGRETAASTCHRVTTHLIEDQTGA